MAAVGSVLSKDVADVLRSVAGGAALPDTAFQAVTTCVFQVLAREEGVTEEDLYGEWSHDVSLHGVLECGELFYDVQECDVLYDECEIFYLVKDLLFFQMNLASLPFLF